MFKVNQSCFRDVQNVDTSNLLKIDLGEHLCPEMHVISFRLNFDKSQEVSAKSQSQPPRYNLNL